MTFPYSKILAFLARLGNALLDYMDNRKWRTTQATRQKVLDAIDKKYQDRLDRLDADYADGLRKERARIKAESSK